MAFANRCHQQHWTQQTNKCNPVNPVSFGGNTFNRGWNNGCYRNGNINANNTKYRQPIHENIIYEDEEDNIDYNGFYQQQFQQYSHKMEITMSNKKNRNNLNSSILNSTNLRKFNQLTNKNKKNNNNQNYQNLSHFTWNEINNDDDPEMDSENNPNPHPFNQDYDEYEQCVDAEDTDLDNNDDINHEETSNLNHDQREIQYVEYAKYNQLEDALSSMEQLRKELNNLTNDIKHQESENIELKERIKYLQANEVYESDQNKDNLYSDEILVNKNNRNKQRISNPINNNANGRYRRFGGTKRKFNDMMNNKNDDDNSTVSKKRKLQFCG